eukprot:TRINITY_DN4409_c0_g1_i1.p1 TRINITY_DN4409_c0_g1~~TRINITY_DN4409_c0_g1_i1.p1  ORF type:complete len:469 (-),score=97.33 TRINITY_DN4409_c0_g1_i1:51-1391(-)
MASAEGAITLEGILKQELPTTFLGVAITNWKERWCRIRGHQLQCFAKKPRDSDTAVAIIDLFKTVLTDLPELKFSIGGSLLARPYTFRASSPVEKAQWMQAIQAATAKSKVGMSDFQLICFIGEGGWGKVFKVKVKATQQVFAMKVIEKEKLRKGADIEATLAEKSFLQEFDHPFIVHLHYTFQTTDKLFMVMDYLAGGDSFFHLTNNDHFDEDVVRLWTAQVALALDYLHTNNILYRDLKPENLVLDTDGNMVLTDFGLSKRTDNGRRRTIVGTRDYMPPEMHREKEYDRSADYWALGCLVYEFIVGNHPFQDEEGSVQGQRIIDAEPIYPPTLSADAKAFIQHLLRKDPIERLHTLEGIKAHKWFDGLDFDKVYRREYPSRFKPDPDDERNFDPEFTQKKAQLKPSEPGEMFKNYSWEGDGSEDPLKAALAQDSAPATESQAAE